MASACLGTVHLEGLWPRSFGDPKASEGGASFRDRVTAGPWGGEACK